MIEQHLTGFDLDPHGNPKKLGPLPERKAQKRHHNGPKALALSRRTRTVPKLTLEARPVKTTRIFRILLLCRRFLTTGRLPISKNCPPVACPLSQLFLPA
ncbi:hypothetical protein MTP99_011051 [Tenebrio molitor]|nr:hypothetical protein MTP99_011051 [Tenebrio molitor]